MWRDMMRSDMQTFQVLQCRVVSRYYASTVYFESFKNRVFSFIFWFWLQFRIQLDFESYGPNSISNMILNLAPISTVTQLLFLPRIQFYLTWSLNLKFSFHLNFWSGWLCLSHDTKTNFYYYFDFHYKL